MPSDDIPPQFAAAWARLVEAHELLRRQVVTIQVESVQMLCLAMCLRGMAEAEQMEPKQ